MYEHSLNQREKDNETNVLISEFSCTKVHLRNMMRPKVHTFLGRQETGMSLSSRFVLRRQNLTWPIPPPKGPTNSLKKEEDKILISGDQGSNYAWKKLIIARKPSCINVQKIDNKSLMHFTTSL